MAAVPGAMLAAMIIRSLLLGAAVACALTLSISAPAEAAPDKPDKPVKVAQKAKKGKGKGDKGDKGDKGEKAADKPADKAAPEGARVDPRTAPSAGDASGASAADVGTRRGMSRIEFDDRLVQGQTNKANAIYLFERRESSLRSLLKKRTDFHEEIDETLE
jgi:hypothetical protein